jgi:Cu-Zn family superoxide dismutase
MTKIAMISTLATASLLLGACGELNDDLAPVRFVIQNVENTPMGTLTLKAHADGGVAIKVEVEGLQPGTRAMHFHEIGLCETPGFKSSGGHFNPAMVAHGEHAGDMMNVEVGADGTGVFEVVNERVSLRGEGDLPALMDADGAALVIHGGADDYTSQPSGAAGPRVACAVVFGG